MRTLRSVCMCLLLAGVTNPALANLDGLQVLSEHYHAEGTYVVYDDGSRLTETYKLDSADSSGVSGSISSKTSPAEWASSSAKQSLPGQLSVSAYAGRQLPTCSSAVASMSFQPETPGWLNTVFFAMSDWPQQAYVSFSDVTEGVPGVLLFHATDVDFGIHAPKGFGNNTWWVEPSHQYSILISAVSSQVDASSASGYVSFTSAPEPTTLLTLGLGLCLIRRPQR